VLHHHLALVSKLVRCRNIVVQRELAASNRTAETVYRVLLIQCSVWAYIQQVNTVDESVHHCDVKVSAVMSVHQCCTAKIVATKLARRSSKLQHSHMKIVSRWSKEICVRQYCVKVCK
jgi:hypothetical protein